MSGQAEPELTLDVDIEGVGDESALVLLSVSLGCVSLGFKSGGKVSLDHWGLQSRRLM